MNVKQIQKRINRAAELSDDQLEIMAEVDESEAIRNSIREAAVADVLVELLECARCGDSLDDAIELIYQNF